MSEFVSINGAITCATDAFIPWNDRGLLYGDGLFETLRVDGGVPRNLDLHLSRLYDSAAFLEISLPSERIVRTWVDHLVNNGSNPAFALRITVTRGAGGTVSGGASHDSMVLMHTRPVLPLTAMQSEDVGVAHALFAPPSLARRIKSLSYLPAVVAQRQLSRAGYREGFLLSRDGHLMEGTVSNVFVVRDGVLMTPSLQTGILPGITRRLVIESAVSNGMAVTEAAVRTTDLVRVTEVFYTNSVRGIVGVSSIDGLWRESERVVTETLQRSLWIEPAV